MLARLLDTPTLQRLFRQSPGGARPARAAAGDHAINRSILDSARFRLHRICLAVRGILEP